jgi:hypothetical protein
MGKSPEGAGFNVLQEEAAPVLRRRGGRGQDGAVFFPRLRQNQYDFVAFSGQRRDIMRAAHRCGNARIPGAGAKRT